MDYKTLLAALYEVQSAIDITIKGRGARAQLSCSIPHGRIPDGWRPVNELGIQRVAGYQRIIKEM